MVATDQPKKQMEQPKKQNRRQKLVCVCHIDPHGLGNFRLECCNGNNIISIDELSKIVCSTCMTDLMRAIKEYYEYVDADFDIALSVVRHVSLMCSGQCINRELGTLLDMLRNGGVNDLFYD